MVKKQSLEYKQINWMLERFVSENRSQLDIDSASVKPKTCMLIMSVAKEQKKGTFSKSSEQHKSIDGNTLEFHEAGVTLTA